MVELEPIDMPGMLEEAPPLLLELLPHAASAIGAKAASSIGSVLLVLLCMVVLSP
jgi:hypothetical protein